MTAIASGESLEDMPAVKGWLRYADAAKAVDIPAKLSELWWYFMFQEGADAENPENIERGFGLQAKWPNGCRKRWRVENTAERRSR
jgi:hypothetical protein